MLDKYYYNLIGALLVELVSVSILACWTYHRNAVNVLPVLCDLGT